MTFRDMADAPRDGTVIEIECSYGVMPWYDIYRWQDDRWMSASKPDHGLGSEEKCRWRPYAGDPAAYRDQTGGAQDTTDYWRRGLRSPRRGIGMSGGGMVLMPGESANLSVSIPILNAPADIGGGLQMTDISAQVFGKYQHCTMARDGMFYADSDFTGGAGFGKPKRGALPSLSQDTSELRALAQEMHEAAARKATARVISSASAPRDPAIVAVPVIAAITCAIIGALSLLVWRL